VRQTITGRYFFVCEDAEMSRMHDGIIDVNNNNNNNNNSKFI